MSNSPHIAPGGGGGPKWTPRTRAWDAAGRGTYVLYIGEHGLRTAIDRMRDRIGSFEASDNLFE